MLKKNRLTIFLAVAFLFISATNNHAAGDIQKVNIGIASAFESTHVQVKAAEEFKKLVESASNKKITVQIHAGGVLGGEDQITELVSTGGVEMMSGGFIPLRTFADDFFFFESPYIFKDWEHFKRVWNSSIGENARKKIIKNGNMEILGLMYRGMRHFSSNFPLKVPESLQGVRLRVPLHDSWVKIWTEVGATTVPIPLNELYTALATGAAQASEGDAEQLFSFKLYEVQDYISLSSHMVQTGQFYVNHLWFNNLNEATQTLIRKAVMQACDYATDLVKKREAETINKMGAHCKIFKDVDKKALREAATPAIDKLFEKQWVYSWEEINNL